MNRVGQIQVVTPPSDMTLEATVRVRVIEQVQQELGMAILNWQCAHNQDHLTLRTLRRKYVELCKTELDSLIATPKAGCIETGYEHEG